ncbi:MAG: hypothetical protein K0R66_250 [Gammaproteobacteria bacterium]|nr:hypothetical protein [Gammaproteobacteria bacterium]
MLKSVIFALCLSSSLLLTGCATMFGDNGRSVAVTSTPAGAKVFLNGEPVGVTPTTVTLASLSNNYILVQKKGYLQTTQQIPTAFQPVGLLNILFLPGFIVDFVSGDMFKLSSSSMNVNMTPAAS